MPESDIITDIRVAATRLGARLFRNNVGVAYRRDGVPIRFGLQPGSHDLIGWTPVTIKAEHVGRTLAVFTGVEVKTPHTSTEKHQSKFHEAVAHAGGISIVARSERDYENEVTKHL